MYPTKEQLEQKWWHRLAKTTFVIFSILIFAISSFLFYTLEESKAREYRIVKTFAQYLGEVKTHTTFKSGSSFRLLAPDSFLDQNDLKDFLLGCSRTNGTIDYLSRFTFIEEIKCDKETGIICIVPQTVCNGNAENIVKYDYRINYKFINYLSITSKTFSTMIAWVILSYLFYYKVLIYVIYGKR